jgi:hypothetical protein
MKISGFTFTKNTAKLYYPLKESILSILDICDEFIIAYAEGDSDDNTLELIKSINSQKIKIIKTVWDTNTRGGAVYAQQTNIALNACSGDWCFYLQSDELVHEKYLEPIKQACETYLLDKRVEGFLFNYKHFWGSYDYFVKNHGWYAQDIRLIRNKIGVYSYRDAQSFRINNNKKLQVIELNAEIFHYGWVRPPEIMIKKDEKMAALYNDREIKITDDYFEYGNMLKMKKFKSSHPLVLEQWIKKFNWLNKLNFGPVKLKREKFKHEEFKYKLITWIETYLFFDKQLFGFNNFKRIK